MRVRGSHGAALVLLVSAATAMNACQPEVLIGTFACPAPDAGQLMSLPFPWISGFERGFCDYMRAGGFCFGDPGASYEIVDAPVHSGRRAAAFSVTSDPARDGAQARCFLQGALPSAATYGVWFFLPSPVKSTGNWNLVHFQGGAPNAWHGLWDVSLNTAADGTLFLYVLDALRGAIHMPDLARPIPIGSWFHVELRLVRAKDAKGEVALYQDGEMLLHLQDVVTDDSDAGQWYVGDLTEAVTPPETMLYVDDVTISATP